MLNRYKLLILNQRAYCSMKTILGLVAAASTFYVINVYFG